MRLLAQLPSRAFQAGAPLLRKTWLRITLLLVATFVVHLPSLQGQLIWDDGYLVGENPFFRSPIFALEVFRHHLFLDSFSGHYRPVQNLSYMLDYLVWNGNLYGYHLSNVLWHAGAGALLFLLLRRLVAPLAADEERRHQLETGAYLVALLWVLHPVHSAAIDYISGRADSLAFAFSCGAWLLYLRGRECRGRLTRAAAYLGAASLLLLGLCAREIAFVWAVIFVVHLLFFTKATGRRHGALAVAVCVLVVVAYAGLRQLPGHRVAQSSDFGYDTAMRAGLMLRALGDYARLTVLPTGLHMERSVIAARMFLPHGTWRDHFAFGPLSACGLLAAGILIYGALKPGQGVKLRRFGALWFTLGFLPISNLVDLNATAAEHWLYLPLAGLLLVFLGWMMELPPRGFQIAVAVGMLFAVTLGMRSTIRSTDWLNAQVFYERTIAAGGWSPRVNLNLAGIYASQGRLDEARRLLERSLQGWPDYPLARTQLAAVLMRQGDRAGADLLLKAAVAAAPHQRTEYPRTWGAALQLAHEDFVQQRPEDALRVIAAARALEPKVWPLAELESEILRRTRGPEAALPVIEKFAAENWWQYSAFVALGKLKAQQGDGAAAIVALQHASWLDIHETQALNLLVRIELRAKNFPAALAAQRRAVSRQPAEPSQYLLFAEVLAQMGRDEQAAQARETARQLEAQARSSA